MKLDSIKELLKERDLIIPGYLLSNYKKLNLDFKELLFLGVVINESSDNLFNAPFISERLNLDIPEVMQIISSLCDKKLIEIEVKKINNKMQEVINVDTIYSKLLLDTNEEEENDSEIYNIIEQELGRTLSPIEYETIGEWLNGGISEDLIKGALKEAVLNGVSNLKYIDKILHEWIKKGYTKASDAKKKKKKEVDSNIFEYDWLDSNEK